MSKSFYVYILTNQSRTLYIGITKNLERRVFEHQSKLVDGFSKKYNVHQLVYFEEFPDSILAISREKQLKKWSRIKKINLINTLNPEWDNLWPDLSTSSR